MNCPKCKSEIAPGLKKCPECGRRIKSAVTRLEPMDGRSDIPALELTKSEVVIGRLGDNDLILPGDSSVSRHHAHIRRQGDHYSIEDNKSRHGVEVNGQKIISSFRLKAGDVVTIGKFRFRFVTPQTSVSASVTSPEVEVDHLRLLLDVTKLINSPVDLKDVLEHVIDSVIRVTRAERGFLMMVSEVGELEFKVALNLDRTEVEVEAGKVKLSFSTVEHVRKTGAPRVLVDIPEAKATEVGSSIHALGLRSIMCVPLKVEDRLIGVIYVDSQRKVEAFSQVDLWLLESLASQAALVIEKRQLYEQLQRYSSSLEDQVRERTADLARANDDLREAYSELEQAQSQVVQSEKLAAVGRLAAGIAHEINSPLGAMTSNMNTLYRSICRLEERWKALPEFAKLDKQLQIQREVEIYREINQSSQAASRRLQEILSAMKNFVGLDQAERKAIDVNEALETTRTLLQHKIGSRIRVVTSCAELPRLVASPGRLHQVFMNLLLNAIQAIEGEGEVKICSECRGKELRITIEDDGKGMTPEQLSHVFDLGFTGKGGRIGAGLGLAITRQIVEEHHGEIRIESEPGAGTKVILSLPLEAGVQAKGNETPPAIRAGGKKPASVG